MSGSRRVEFANGYSADLIYNTVSNSFTLRLYSPNELQIASVPTDEEHFYAAAEGLMYGYFAGFRDCKQKLAKEILEVCNKDFMTR